MGFLDGLFSSMVESGAKAMENKYEDMSMQELEREWRQAFGDNSDFLSKGRYDYNSPRGVLDRVYSRRKGIKSFWQKCQEYDKAKEKEKQLAAEDEGFVSIIKNNEAFGEMVSQINEYGIEARYIVVDASNVKCTNDEKEVLCFQLQQMGIINVNERQIKIICEYLQNNLSLKYVFLSKEKNTLEINQEVFKKLEEERFKNSLSDNEMVKDIITKINALKYDAYHIELYIKDITCLNSKGKKLLCVWIMDILR